MPADWFLLAALALGHLCLVILLVNVSHGFTIDGPLKNLIVLALLAVLGGLTVWVGWSVAGNPWHAWPLSLRLYALPCWLIALVGFPVVTMARLFKKPPLGVSTQAAEVDLTLALGAVPAAGDGKHAWLLRLPGNQSLRLETVSCQVELPGLPPTCDGLSIIHLTDTHFSRAYDRRYFDALADQAAQLEPDLVLCTGDLIDDDDTLAWIEPILGRVRGRLGQFAILGNHDLDHHPDRITLELERAGYTVLEGRWARLNPDGPTLAIGGTSAPWGPLLDPLVRPSADLTILLSHTPDQFYRAASWGIDLMFSGHNHGGQVRLPIIGPVLMPSRFGRRFDHGFYRRDRTLMYVSRGLGANHPIRYRCLPELTRFELRCTDPRPLTPSALRANNLRIAARLRPLIGEEVEMIGEEVENSPFRDSTHMTRSG